MKKTIFLFMLMLISFFISAQIGLSKDIINKRIANQFVIKQSHHNSMFIRTKDDLRIEYFFKNNKCHQIFITNPKLTIVQWSKYIQSNGYIQTNTPGNYVNWKQKTQCKLIILKGEGIGCLITKITYQK